MSSRNQLRQTPLTPTILTVAILGLAAERAAGQHQLAADAEHLALREALVIGRVGTYGRNPLHIDPIQHSIATGAWTAPQQGDVVVASDGTERTWQMIDDIGGEFFTESDNRQGYALVTIDSAADRVMLLHATGHGMAYVNGEPRCGDPYATGFVHLPVHLRAGANHLLFYHGRGGLSAELTAPRETLSFNAADVTTPDLIIGENKSVWAAVPVINATDAIVGQLAIVASLEPDGPSTTTPLPRLAPLTVNKVPFQIDAGPIDQAGDVTLRIELQDLSATDPRGLDVASITLRKREPHQTHKRTFVSAIDGSVQYYAVQPRAAARSGEPDAAQPALVLSLHGAGVEAIRQAESYAPKDWCHIICPTNRRPYGFDWEDWGRLDALEALAHAAQTYDIDPQRVYLSGHSMGGHGTWQLGALFPDRFAAIAPSAGWTSFASYTGAAQLDANDPIQSMLQRAASPSDTAKCLANYASEGVYILHGSADGNVPVAQARDMVKRLAEFHPDFAYFEQPGAGHWWDGERGGGADCVDWPPIFELFQRRRIPASDAVHRIDFATATPGVSASSHWVTIQQQRAQMVPSRVTIERDLERRSIIGTTENVEMLLIDTSAWTDDAPLSVTLDGQVLEDVPLPANGEHLTLMRERGSWKTPSKPVRATLKNPQRCGPFKDAFRNDAILVYSTLGSPEENAWSFAKARFDAETFWYRGNGSFELMRDVDFAPDQTKDRNVILYGNPRTNAVWKTSPNQFWVDIGTSTITVGNRSVRGDDLGCLFIQPRSDSNVASIGVVGGTSLAGMRAVERLPYFLSGVGYPDIFIMSADALRTGYGDVLATGFFGQNWSATTGEIAWRESP